jgi:hypothetical protein
MVLGKCAMRQRYWRGGTAKTCSKDISPNSRKNTAVGVQEAHLIELLNSFLAATSKSRIREEEHENS